MKSEIEKLERIVLEPGTVSVIKEISNQLNLEVGELVHVTQKNVANFIIRKRCNLLTANEMSEFLSENYDLVKALKHATQKAIKAKHSGDDIEINSLLKFIQTPSVKRELNTQNVRGRKKKEISSSSTYNIEALEDTAILASGDGKNDQPEISKIDSNSINNKINSTNKSS